MDQNGRVPPAAWLSRIRLPWKAGLLLALLSFLLLYGAVALSVPQPGGGNHPPAFFSTQFVHGLAFRLQYLLPPLFLLIALLDWQARRRELAAASNPTLQALDGIGWDAFELRVAAAFQQQGFTVRSRGGRAAAGGVDVVLTRGRDVFLVQYQQCRQAKVAEQAVRELHAVMAAARATGGVILSAGQFSAAARLFAHDHGIELIDGPALLALIAGSDTPAEQTTVVATGQAGDCATSRQFERIES